MARGQCPMIYRIGFWDHGWNLFFPEGVWPGEIMIGILRGQKNKRGRFFEMCSYFPLTYCSSGSLIFVIFEKVQDLKYYKSPLSVLV